MDGIIEVCDARNSVGCERVQGMRLGRKEGIWMEKVDLEYIGCSNDLETRTIQSRT